MSSPLAIPVRHPNGGLFPSKPGKGPSFVAPDGFFLMVVAAQSGSGHRPLPTHLGPCPSVSGVPVSSLGPQGPPRGLRRLTALVPCSPVTRIVRVIGQPRGNMLLVGIGGSGRQSLARLASSICEYITFQIEVSKHYRKQEFREGTAGLLNQRALGLA